MELLARIEAFARDAPTRPAYVRPDGGALTYGDLASAVRARRTAIGRRAVPGNTIVLVAGNHVDVPAAFLGALAAGVSVLLVPESSSPAEIASLAARVAAVATLRPADLDGGDVPTPGASVAAGDLLLTTSGSTDAPKIVRRDAASLDAVAANACEAVNITSADVVLATVPLAHSYGLEHGLLVPLWAGATVALCEGLDVDAIAAAAARGVTIFPSVPAVLERLALVSDALAGLSRVRAVYSAGAPLPDGVRDRYVARYATPVGQLYGSTEIGTVTYRPGGRGVGVGWPMRGVSVRILDGGAVAVRAPSMFNGYVGEAADLVDGHFVTGDLGHVAGDGSLVLTGRGKLLIDSGGVKVNPLEVEAVLGQHPGVAACVVVPLRQSEAVCRLRALVEPRDAAEPPDEASLRAFARARLAPHKVPRVFEIVARLPRSATGKPLRHMLADP